jgi:uncharacterized membrane protein YkoI
MQSHQRKEKTMTSPAKSFVRAGVAAALLAGCSAAMADFDASAVFPPIDACIDLASQQQEGIVIGWKLTNPVANNVEVDILAPDDRVWNLKCTNGKVGAPERKLGNKNFKMLKTRAKVPEKSARFTAVGSYPIAEVRTMKYDTSWRGRPYYSYEMVLNDGREASVDVNAETGQVDRSKSERKE